MGYHITHIYRSVYLLKSLGLLVAVDLKYTECKFEPEQVARATSPRVTSLMLFCQIKIPFRHNTLKRIKLLRH